MSLFDISQSSIKPSKMVLLRFATCFLRKTQCFPSNDE